MTDIMSIALGSGLVLDAAFRVEGCPFWLVGYNVLGGVHGGI
jgi:hypothetical protein